MAIMHFDPKTAHGSVDCRRCLRAWFRDMGEVCTLVVFIIVSSLNINGDPNPHFSSLRSMEACRSPSEITGEYL